MLNLWAVVLSSTVLAKCFTKWRAKRVVPHCETYFCKFAIVVSKKSASGLCAIKANSAFQ